MADTAQSILNTISNTLPSTAQIQNTIGMSPTLPKTYKAAVFKSQGSPLSIETLELKNPHEGEVLVKIEACGVCHSDDMTRNNVYGAGFPMTPGHEMIGHVVAVAPGEKHWKIGDRVGGPWHGGHDGSCKACQLGYYQMCDNEQVNGETRPGGYAEYCLLRSEAAVPIPAHLDAAETAPLLCAGVTVFNSIRRLGVQPGSLVGVQGLGGLGHLAVQFANKFGYHVVAISRGADKEKFARDLGAHEYIDTEKEDASKALQRMGGAALIVTTAPNASAISPLIHGLGLQGKLLILAAVGDVPVDSYAMIHYGLSVHSYPSGHQLDSADAIAFAERFGIKCMVETFPLDKANDAFEHMMSGKARFRAVVKP